MSTMSSTIVLVHTRTHVQACAHMRTHEYYEYYSTTHSTMSTHSTTHSTTLAVAVAIICGYSQIKLC